MRSVYKHPLTLSLGPPQTITGCRYVLRGAEVFSFSMLEHVLAAGSNGSVVFWDRRAGSKPLAQLDDTHMDDVTQVGWCAY